ncbi:hypothetical protein ZTR_09857 [Talaromyces verruculosus]|nr:hypothetical protein ZTR_09857 [Talaromyces verruculosus]
MESAVDGTGSNNVGSGIIPPIDIVPPSTSDRDNALRVTEAASRMGPLIVTSDQQSADSSTIMGTHNAARTPQDNNPDISRPKAGLFLRKEGTAIKFVGRSSIAATLSTCLRDSIQACGGALQLNSLDYVVQTMRYVDELNNSTLAGNKQSFLLPEVELAERCIPAYFTNIHLRYPIMESQIFSTWRDFYEEGGKHPDPLVVSKLLLIVAIGMMTLHSDLIAPLQPLDVASALYERAWSLLPLILESPYTDSVQILLLHTIYLFHCGKHGIAWITCGFAVRIGQSLGLHLLPPVGLRLLPEEIRIWSRLWCVAYTLDAFLALTEGRPVAIYDNPSDVEKQGLESGECPTNMACLPATRIYRWNLELALIVNKTCRLLNQDSSMEDLPSELTDIDSALLSWRDSIPIEFRPEQENVSFGPLHSLIGWLHAQYFNTVRTVHWLSAEQRIGDWANMSARMKSSESICVASARLLITTLNDTLNETCDPNGFSGIPESFCIAAVSVIFRAITRNPRRISVRTDLELLRTGVIHILQALRNKPHLKLLFERMEQAAEEVVSRKLR